MTLTGQIALLLAAAVIAVPLFRRLRLGAVLGYLAAGMAIGPWGFGLITDVERILGFSEFGVVMLLFVIGLELQPARLWALRRTVFGLGSLQVAACTLALGAAGMALGLGAVPALVIGFALSLSSTALVLQVLAEREELKTQHGRSAFGVLLFQDIAVMPVLAVLPLLGAGGVVGGMNWHGFALGLGAFAAVAIGGRWLLRPVLRLVAETRVQEAFTAATLLVVVGTAALFHAVGLSMALGAFIAGLLLADSEHRHELEADIEPFKGLLLGLFFIAVGMSAQLGLVAEHPLSVLGLALGLMTIKALAVYGVARYAQHGTRSARSLAVALAGGGEFAFVLFALATRQSLLDPETVDLLTVAVTTSLLFAPLFMILHARLEQRYAPPAPPPQFDTIEDDEPRVIIAGFGRFGQIVGRVLRARGIRFTALEISQAQVDFVRRFGNRLYYGDASRLELLRAARADEATVLVIAMDDEEACVRCAELARRHFPQLRVYVRVRNRQHAFRVMDLGVHLVIRELLGSSLEMAEAVLVSVGVPSAEARRNVRTFKEHDERTLLAQQSIKDDPDKIVAAAKEASEQLQKLFEADVQEISKSR